MKPWHYARIKINAVYPWQDRPLPYQTGYKNWIFFWVHYRHDATKTPFRNSFVPMHTLGLDGVE